MVLCVFWGLGQGQDIVDYLGYSFEVIDWNFFIQFGGCVEGVCQWWVFDNWDVVVFGQFVDVQCDFVYIFGNIDWCWCFFLFVVEGNGVVGWVGDDDGGIGYFGYYLFLGVFLVQLM